MGGHLTLPGKCHLSLRAFGRLDTYWGTFDIFQAMSNVPEGIGEARHLLEDI